MSTGAKIVAVILAIGAITYTFPRVARMLRDDNRVQEKPVLEQALDREPRWPGPGADDMGPDPRPYLWQERILRVTDYATFVGEALPAAERGDADAQFALYAAFAFCRDGMMERTPEQRARIPAALWDDMHRRCDALVAQYPDLAGEASSWLQRSLDADFPRAIAFSAREDIERLERGEIRGAQAEALVPLLKSRLVTALAANDPAITEGISTKLGPLFPGDSRVETAYWVWRLAACEQGLDCGPQVEWLHDVCRIRDNCIRGESGQEYIRRVSGDLPSLQARARDMARKLRKGEFTLADFDQSVTSLPQPGRERPSRPSARIDRTG